MIRSIILLFALVGVLRCGGSDDSKPPPNLDAITTCAEFCTAYFEICIGENNGFAHAAQGACLDECAACTLGRAVDDLRDALQQCAGGDSPDTCNTSCGATAGLWLNGGVEECPLR